LELPKLKESFFQNQSKFSTDARKRTVVPPGMVAFLVNFNVAPHCRPRSVALPGAKASTPLPCDRCVGRSLNLCKPLDDVRLQTMLGLGGIRHWRKHETMFRAGDPMD
jgi:hypothetical protein